MFHSRAFFSALSLVVILSAAPAATADDETAPLFSSSAYESSVNEPTPEVVEGSVPGSATATQTYYAPPPGGIMVQPLEVFGPQLRFRSDIGSGLYDDSFYTLGLMVPFHIEPLETMWFVEARGYATEYSRYGGNVGVGYRWYDAAEDRVNGISFWYDDDNTNVHQYQQLGLSLETLSYDCDGRLNLYYPTNSDANQLWQTPIFDPFYKGSNIFFRQNTRWETPYMGGDFEVGVPVPFLDDDWNTKMFAGGYYLDADGQEAAIGPRLRLQAEITPSVLTQLQFTHDSTWNSRLTFAVMVNLPGGPRDEYLAQQPMQHKLASQVQRDYRLHAHRNTDRQGLIAINPDDNQPFVVTHVNNTAGAGGDGTYENPLNMLPAAADPATDIIFVRRGDETYTGLDGGITLSANQRLLSESVPHAFEAVRGRFQLPGYNAGALPFLYSTAGPVVTLGNNTEVAGFHIEAPNGGGDGIVGMGIADFMIRDNEITRTENAIVVTNTTGRGNLVDNTITGNARNGVTLSTNVAGAMTLTAINNTIGGNAGDAIDATVAGNGRVTILAQSGNYSNNNFNGFSVVTSGNGSARFTLMQDRFNNTPTVSNNRFDGVHNVSQDTSTLWAAIQNSTVSNNNLFGLFSREEDASTAALNISGSTVSGNGAGNIVILP